MTSSKKSPDAQNIRDDAKLRQWSWSSLGSKTFGSCSTREQTNLSSKKALCCSNQFKHLRFPFCCQCEQWDCLVIHLHHLLLWRVCFKLSRRTRKRMSRQFQRLCLPQSEAKSMNAVVWKMPKELSITWRKFRTVNLNNFLSMPLVISPQKMPSMSAVPSWNQTSKVKSGNTVQMKRRQKQSLRKW